MFTNKIIKLTRLAWRDQLLLVEAFILTGVIRLAILFVSFQSIASLMGLHIAESPLQTNRTACAASQKIGWAVAIVSLYTPWESKCLVQGLTAQTMLKRRKIGSTLYLGVARSRESRLIAHAWLRSGTEVITGGLGWKWFTVVAGFASRVGGNKQ